MARATNRDSPRAPTRRRTAAARSPGILTESLAAGSAMQNSYHGRKVVANRSVSQWEEVWSKSDAHDHAVDAEGDAHARAREHCHHDAAHDERAADHQAGHRERATAFGGLARA